MNTLMLNGVVEKVEEKMTGQGKPFSKLNVMCQWGYGQYAKRGCVEVVFFGDASKATLGSAVIVQGEVRGREHEGRWYTEIVSREIYKLS